MLTIFNRKEVTASFSMEEQAQIKDVLEQHGIKYYEKVINRRSSSPFGNGTRALTGSFGESFAHTYEYIIYVHKKDFGLAQRYIHEQGK